MKRWSQVEKPHTKRQRGTTIITDVGEAVAGVLRCIPRGQTRSKMEVFRAALMSMGRGDEGIDTGVRTVLGGKLRQLVASRAVGWHRVVSSDGDFWEGRGVAANQLRVLQAEGARPKDGELVRAWASRVRAVWVGCFKSSKGRACVSARDASVDAWPASAVEPLKGKAALRDHLRLSGGKLFRLPGEEEVAPPPFHCQTDRRPHAPPTSGTLASKLALRVKDAMTKTALHELHQTGATCLRGLLRPQDCAGLLHYAEHADFYDVVRLHGEAGSGGSYHFCKKPPALVEVLRKTIFAGLLLEQPSLATKFGNDIHALELRCQAAGQRRSATIFLSFGEGGLNLAHQDPYGTLFFPYQAMLMLSRRGRDFNGGEFFVKNMKTGKALDVAADEGDLTVFVANNSAIKGSDFKHGVRAIRAGQNGVGERFSVGIVFNLRK